MRAPVARMNHCFTGPPVSELLAALDDPDWPVQLAALVALGDRRDPTTLEALLRVLEVETAAPLYTQPGELAHVGAAQATAAKPVFPPGTTDLMKAAWERRSRLKQAACLALGALRMVEARVIAALGACATTAGDDYPARAAAAKALGLLGDPSGIPFLERAAQDEEWCTRTEARKALMRLQNR